MGYELPFIRHSTLPGQHQADVVLGFTLPYLPDMLSSPWLRGANEQERLVQALQLQQRLIHTLWQSGITGLDLRYLATEEIPGVAIALLSRFHRPEQVPPSQFRDYCLGRAKWLQQLFADFGFELQPLQDERSLVRYIAPFQFNAIAEIRRFEEIVIIENAYQEFEVYATYPWSWVATNRIRLFEALLHRESNCLISVYLEPTQLTQHELNHFAHATSGQVADFLWHSGPHGQAINTIYQGYARSLRQPFLLRISIVSSAPHVAQQIGRIFLDELGEKQPHNRLEQAYLNKSGVSYSTATGAVMETPLNQQDWQKANQGIFHLTWQPWGIQKGAALPGTTRLRFLMDDSEVSMPFRLPVTRLTDVSGVPVRARLPSTSTTQQSNTPSSRSTSPLTGTSWQRPQDLVGKILGNCQLESLIGQGGFGAVYRAFQPQLNRYVAVKVMLSLASAGSSETLRVQLERFTREAQAVARLDHPHILSIFEYQTSPLPYIVMPYVAGGSLADEIKASGQRPLSSAGVATIVQQIAQALDHAHQHHLVHRDLKPANLLRHQDGRILLADFGIVQIDGVETSIQPGEKHRSPFTPAYASPEQHQGLKVDYRSDIFSLGVVIYELLTGQRPFSSEYSIVYSPPPSISNLSTKAIPALEAVVMKALAKQPEQRYQSAGALASAFQAAI